ncbi:MAG TPA: flagellar hook-length control protein FliK [Nitrospirota bacterium]
MNMPFVMPAAHKTADAGQTAAKSGAVKRNESRVEDNEIFSELLLILSSARNDMTMPQSEENVALSTGLNHVNDFQKGQLTQFDSITLVRHLHDHNEYGEDDGTIKDPSDINIHSSGMEIPLPAMDDTESYKGSHDMESFRENFNKHMEPAPDMTADVTPEIISNLVREVTGGNGDEAVQPAVHTGRSEIISQLSEKLADMYHIGGHSAKIRLQPEELGHLNIDISVVNDSIKAIVTVEENSVKDLLEANIDMLVKELKGSGLNIDQFTVRISSSFYDGNLTGGWSDRNRREMFSDETFSQPPVYDDITLHDSMNRNIYAGSGGISIFV